MNRFHKDRVGKSTGHRWVPSDHKLVLRDGRVVRVREDARSELPLMQLKPLSVCPVMFGDMHVKHAVHSAVMNGDVDVYVM